MVATAAQRKPLTPTTPTIEEKKVKPISWEEFQKKYLTREDSYKYEWVDGMVEKTKRTMEKAQFYLLNNLLTFFHRLLFDGKVTGQLIPEGDVFFKGNHRRPDIAWFSPEQLVLTAKNENDTPLFVIEVTSTNDAANRVYRKMQNYREAGVKVVWHIYPDLEEVHVFSGKQLDKMSICAGDQTCSAAPVLLDFVMPVSDIFKKPR